MNQLKDSISKTFHKFYSTINDHVLPAFIPAYEDSINSSHTSSQVVHRMSLEERIKKARNDTDSSFDDNESVHVKECDSDCSDCFDIIKTKNAHQLVEHHDELERSKLGKSGVFAYDKVTGHKIIDQSRDVKFSLDSSLNSEAARQEDASMQRAKRFKRNFPYSLFQKHQDAEIAFDLGAALAKVDQEIFEEKRMSLLRESQFKDESQNVDHLAPNLSGIINNQGLQTKLTFGRKDIDQTNLAERDESFEELKLITDSLKKMGLNERQRKQERDRTFENLVSSPNMFKNQIIMQSNIVTSSKKRKYDEISNTQMADAQSHSVRFIDPQTLKIQRISKQQQIKQIIDVHDHYAVFYELAQVKPSIQLSPHGQQIKPNAIRIVDVKQNLIDQSSVEKLTVIFPDHLNSEYISSNPDEPVISNGINVTYLNNILNSLTKNHPYDRLQSIDDSDVAIKSVRYGYHLTKKSLQVLLNKHKISDEIINAYIMLLAQQRNPQPRSTAQILEPKNPIQFHLFDSLFFFKLNCLMNTDQYNFLRFSSYFDKLHYASPKIVTPLSVFLFVINNEEYDYAVILVDISTQRIIVFDPIQNRQKDTFLLEVKKIKRFLSDYFECFPPQLSNDNIHQSRNVSDIDIVSVQSKESFGKTGSIEIARELKLHEIELWKLEKGVCADINGELLRKYGQGVCVMKYLDLLTQQRPPEFSIDSERVIEDLYNQFACELVSSRLITYTQLN